MGRRIWYLKCLDCKREFAKVFEHLNQGEAIETLESFSCENCGSSILKFTGEASFSGGKKKQDRDILVFCNSCSSKSKLEVSGVQIKDIISKIKTKNCESCNSSDWEISDATFEGYVG